MLRLSCLFSQGPARAENNWLRREACASRCDDGATYLADAAEKHSVLLVDLDRTSEAVFGVSKLVLAQIGRPETVPVAAKGMIWSDNDHSGQMR